MPLIDKGAAVNGCAYLVKLGAKRVGYFQLEWIDVIAKNAYT